MSIFDDVKGMANSDVVKRMADSDTVKKMVASESGEHPGLVSHAVDMVKDPSTGGISGLMQKFHENGLGDAVKSWISPGGNHPITAEQITKVLGEDRVNEIASKFGMSAEEASAKLANVLPTVVSKLTSGGAAAAA
jgi:uncharacterized protein YidB (DUF937 family)